MQWSIDSCQNKVSADHNHLTTSRFQVKSSWRSRLFSTDQVLTLDWITGPCLGNFKASSCLEVILIFFTAFVLCSLRLLKLKTKGPTM